MSSEQQPLRANESCLSTKRILDWQHGRLTDAEAEQVLSHLATCSHCSEQEALLLDQEMNVMNLLADLAPQQEHIPDRVAAFVRLSNALEAQQLNVPDDVAAPVTQQGLRWLRSIGTLSLVVRVQNAMVHFWLVCQRQTLVIHKSIWYVTALVLLLMNCAFYLVVPHLLRPMSVLDLTWFLVLMVTTASMVGVVYAQNQESEAELEIVLSTSTSIAIIVCARVLLVIGYNILLATASTIFLAHTLGGGIWEITLQWLGPLLFFSAIGFLASQFVSAEMTVIAVLLLEVTLYMSFSFEKGIPTLQLVHTSLWNTSPLLLGVALLLMACAVFNAPRHIQLHA